MTFQEKRGGLQFSQPYSSNPISDVYYKDVLRRGGGHQVVAGFWYVPLSNWDEGVTYKDINVQATIVDEGFDHAGSTIAVDVVGEIRSFDVNMICLGVFHYLSSEKNTHLHICAMGQPRVLLPVRDKLSLWLEATTDSRQHLYCRQRIVVRRNGFGIVTLKLD